MVPALGRPISKAYQPFYQYKICVLSLTGDLLATFSPDPDPGFGVRNVAWHPNGLFLLVSGWDDKVRLPCPRVSLLVADRRSQVHILDSLTWSPVATLELTSRIPSTAVSTTVTSD